MPAHTVVARLRLSLVAIATLFVFTPQVFAAAKLPAFYVSVAGTQTQAWDTAYAVTEDYRDLACGQRRHWQVTGRGSTTIAIGNANNRSLLLRGLLYSRSGVPVLTMQGSLKTRVTRTGQINWNRDDPCPDGERTSSDARSGCGTKTAYRRYSSLAPDGGNWRARVVFLKSYDLLPDTEPCPRPSPDHSPVCARIMGLENLSQDLTHYLLGVGTQLNAKRFRNARKPFIITIKNTRLCTTTGGKRGLGSVDPGSIIKMRITSNLRFKFYPGYKCGFDVCLYRPLPKRL